MKIFTVAYFLCAGFALAASLVQCTGCQDPKTSSAAAEAAFQAELLSCVDQSKTVTESHACREKVEAKWKK